MDAKSPIDLTPLSVAELERLKGQVEKQIEIKKKEEEEAAFAKLDQLAKELGITRERLRERYAKKTKPRRKPAPPKYRNPAKPAQTWSGRGRSPAWVQKHLDDGGKLEDLAIKR